GHGSNPMNLSNDQRGDTYARAVGGTVDIGAYELQTVATPPLLGDYGGNQVVDAPDYVIWRKTKGADVPQYSGADGNGSSKIDDGDYDVWRAHFGVAASGSAAAAGAESSFGAEGTPSVELAVHTNDSVHTDALNDAIPSGAIKLLTRTTSKPLA